MESKANLHWFFTNEGAWTDGADLSLAPGRELLECVAGQGGVCATQLETDAFQLTLPSSQDTGRRGCLDQPAESGVSQDAGGYAIIKKRIPGRPGKENRSQARDSARRLGRRVGAAMVFVHLLPSLIPEDGLRGGLAVVIDVLRATTMIVHALVAGCTEVIPVNEVEEARRIAAALPVGSALLAGERQGLPIDGFDLGNSPGECTAARCRGKTMVITTTNGTRALLACRDAEHVFLGAFVNFTATCRRLLVESKPIHLVCAGTDGRISYEDTLAAGAFAKKFKDLGHAMGDDEAEIAAGLWTSVQSSLGLCAGQNDSVADGGSLAAYLTRGRGGRRVVELGRGDDIATAAWLDRPDHQIVAEFQREPPRIVAGCGQGNGKHGGCSGSV